MARVARRSAITASVFIRKHPQLTASELMQAAAARGLQMTLRLINTVRFLHRPAPDPVARTRPRRRVAAPRVSPSNREAEFSRLINEIGIQRAREHLAAMERAQRRDSSPAN
jgi:hypothetical protein